MNLYHWYSEALRQHSCGDILAIGRDVEEARQSARAGIEGAIAHNWEHLIDAGEEDEIADKRRRLEEDIARELTLVGGGAAFIRGGE